MHELDRFIAKHSDKEGLKFQPHLSWILRNLLPRRQVMKKIIRSMAQLKCPCGNVIKAGELIEIRMDGSRKRAFRCLGCYVAAPCHWVTPVRKGIPYHKALVTL